MPQVYNLNKRLQQKRWFIASKDHNSQRTVSSFPPY
jgi:hypothetical protein